MEKRKLRLGPLETQFFAWIQFAGKKSVETDELNKVLKITLKQEEK
jgi:hypothetical protein